jgi:hypothetical protein
VTVRRTALCFHVQLVLHAGEIYNSTERIASLYDYIRRLNSSKVINDEYELAYANDYCNSDYALITRQLYA